MLRPRLDLLAALTGCLAALVGSAAANAQSAPVALAGQIAPDTGGGTYASFGFVDVSRDGERTSQVLFSAAVSGGTAPGGLFTVSEAPSPGQVSRAIALVGAVAPGDPYPSPVTFAALQGATTSVSEVAFLATFDVPGQAAIYVADPETGEMTLIAKVGGPAPTGAMFQQLRVPSNHCGDVVFAADVGPNALAVTHGIFRSAGGVVSAVALQGDPAPGFPTGETFLSFGDPSCVNGDVGFSAQVVSLPTLPTSGLFRYAGGTGELVAAQGEPSPDGVPYGAFSTESPGTSFERFGYTDGAGMFMSASDGGFFPAVSLARLGETAPGTGGGTFSAYPHGPALMSSDIGTHLVTYADVSGASASSGVFTMSRGFDSQLYVGAAAIAGNPAPGTGGGTYAAFSRPSADDAINPYIGDDGVIAFSADVSGGTTSSGVFVLPEPGARLAGAVLLALLSIGRRRSP
jgi:hypothetical protein